MWVGGLPFSLAAASWKSDETRGLRFAESEPVEHDLEDFVAARTRARAARAAERATKRGRGLGSIVRDRLLSR